MVGEITAVVYLGAIVYLAVRAARSRTHLWQDAVQACGLEVVEAVRGLNPRVVARSGDVEVRIRPSGEGGRALVSVKASGPPDFQKVRLRPQEMVQFTREIEVGDKPFDGQFAIDGPVALVSALLDQENRRLLSAVDGRLDLTLGELRVNVPDTSVSHVLRPLLRARDRLSQPLDVAQRLAGNARQDPLPGVRLHNLFVLVRELPDHPLTAETLRAARSDPSPEVRLRAARSLGAEGRPLLRELAEGMEDDAVSAEAVKTLGRELPFERASAILDRALSRRRLRTAKACLNSISVAENPAAEPLLIQTLKDRNAEIRITAAIVLGRMGSAAAVLPLQEAAEHRTEAELRRAVRQAIGEIQARIQGASPGQLSLTEGETGQLSLSDQQGKLSLPPES